jgi:hypothetical protein
MRHPVQTLSEGELRRAGGGGRRLRRERRRRWEAFCRSKPPGQLDLIERYTPRSIRAESIAMAVGSRRMRLERRRARALLLGALMLRRALLQAFPSCHSSLWLYGVP